MVPTDTSSLTPVRDPAAAGPELASAVYHTTTSVHDCPITRTSPVTFERMTSRDNIVQYGLDDVRISDVT